MTSALLAVAWAALAFALTVWSCSVLRPQAAARMTGAALVVALVVAVPFVAVLAMSWLAHLPFVGAHLRWCALAVGMHRAAPTWVGVPATAALLVGVVRLVGALRAHRRSVCHEPGPVDVVADSRPFALTLPGRGGRVVVSSALVDMLDPAERAAVIAHEGAHAHHRHDRYLLLAACAQSLVPPVAPAATRLRVALERWADEVAAAACGDRTLVAQVLGQVALIPHTSDTVAGIGQGAVTCRVAALLSAEPPRPAWWVRALPGVCLAAALVAAGATLMSLGPMVATLCHH